MKCNRQWKINLHFDFDPFSSYKWIAQSLSLFFSFPSLLSSLLPIYLMGLCLGRNVGKHHPTSVIFSVCVSQFMKLEGPMVSRGAYRVLFSS